MISYKIYSAVPFQQDSENVLAFLKQSDRDNFLADYIIQSGTDSRADAFYDAQRVLNVTSQNDLTAANYLEIYDGERYLYYFVTGAVVLPQRNADANGKTYQLTLTADIWQSDFFKYTGSDDLTISDVFNANLSQTTNTDIAGERTAIELPATIMPLAVDEQLADTTHVYIIAYYAAQDGAIFPLYYLSTLDSALTTQIIAMSNANKIKIGLTGTDETNIAIMRMFVIPQNLINIDAFGDDWYNLNTAPGIFGGHSYDNVRRYAPTYQTDTVTFNATIDRTTVQRVGTLFNLLDLAPEYDDNTRDIDIVTVISPFSLSVKMRVAGREIDITSDFETSVPYNENSAYIQQHLLSTAFSVGAGAATELARGTTAGAGIAAAGLSLLQNGISIAEQLATPATQRGSGDGLANIIAGGLNLYAAHAANADTAQLKEKMIGYNVQQYVKRLV